MLVRNTSRFSLQSFCKLFTKGVVAVLVAFFSTITIVSAQISVGAPGSPTNLVQNVLVGTGVTVSGVNFTGAPISYGTFNGTNSNIGLNNGVIITTGSRGGAIGPNNDTGPGSGQNNGTPGDADLDQLSGFQTYDASILEFDFIPQSNQISFNYVFASEEYPEFVGQQYNDIFAFFITGPNPAGGNYSNSNIALIPGTSIPVAINNVNNVSFNNYYVDNTGGATVQYDGFTKPLTAQANVVPCSTYHIKIAIADAGDPIYDSAVLLQALSFSSSTNDILAEVTYGSNNGVLYEGCGQANITFTKSVATAVADTFNVSITGNATNGVDYSQFPIQVIFPPGDTAVVVPLVPTFDGISEPNETVTITISQNICGTIITKSVSLVITNVDPLVVTSSVNDTIICPNVPVPIQSFVSGGISPYTFSWSEGQTTQNITVFPQQTTTYTVNVTDNCQAQTGQAQTTIYLLNYTPLALVSTPDTNICPGDSILLTAVGSGGRGGPLQYVYTWSDSLGNGQSVWVSPTENHTYSVTISDSCGTTVTNFINVDVLPTNADFDYYYIQNRIVKFQDLSSDDVLYWYWDFGDGDTARAQSPLHNYADTGLYRVTLVVENKYGCTDTIVRFIRAYPDYALYVPNAFTPNGDGTNENFSAIGEGFVNYEMYIFNRWGEQVFTSTDYARRWDGRDKSGQISPQGIYVYLIRVKTPPGDEYTLRGSVALIN